MPAYPPSRGTLLAAICGVLVASVVIFAVASAQPAEATGPVPTAGLTPEQVAAVNALVAAKGSSWSEWFQAIAPYLVVMGAPFVARFAQWKPSLTVHLSDEQMMKIGESLNLAPAMARIEEKLETHGEELKPLRELKHGIPNQLSPIQLQVGLIEQKIDTLTERVEDELLGRRGPSRR